MVIVAIQNTNEILLSQKETMAKERKLVSTEVIGTNSSKKADTRYLLNSISSHKDSEKK